MPKKKKPTNYAPRVLGRNADKLSAFRIQREHPKGSKERYPLGRYPFRCDIAFGSKTMTRQGALRINTPAAIENSADKLRTKAIWDNENIPHVVNYHKIEEFITVDHSGGQSLVNFDLDAFEEAMDYPVILKKRRGSGGQGMFICEDEDQLVARLTEIAGNNPDNYREVYFLEEFFHATHEYRIHVSSWLYNFPVYYQFEYTHTNEDGERSLVSDPPECRRDGVICASRKLIRQEAWDAGRRTRNITDDGGVYMTHRFVRPNNWNDIVESAVEAITVLDLDFGFVDCMYNSETGQFVFSESGTNPGMQTNPELLHQNITQQHYLQALPHIVLNKAQENKIYRKRVRNIVLQRTSGSV